MGLSRRAFLAGGAACASGLAGGCKAINNVPLVEADGRGSFPIPPALSAPGTQVKVQLPNAEGLVLVWKTEGGYGAASITCTHRGSEVRYDAREDALDCPSHGSRFRPDGSVLQGPAKKALRAYVLEREGDRLRILG